MASEYSEADWKVLRQLHPIALERLCARILGEVVSASTVATRSHHQRYLDVFDLIRRRDRELESAFNDMRRSRMLERVMSIKRLGLLTDAEFGRFSHEMQTIVTDLLAHAAFS